ncbi:hypothetical protein RvY_16771 [Ramazzottius varieornatus]|uniref:Uncharacterized protein n=1 Tax=Ramazzottius varieornatus TaxID=947166 RepID=A0A1D1W5X7_RAMVA|nr:hypothetical protein RvY_16771 [Ramazzottius varieornatus]
MSGPVATIVGAQPSNPTQPILRPDFGGLGDRIKLRSNRFKVACPTKGFFFRYDVDITVEKKAREGGKGDGKPNRAPRGGEGDAPRISKPVKRKIWKAYVAATLKPVFGDSMPVFDGEKILYTAKEAKMASKDGHTATVTVPKDPDGSEVVATVTVKPCNPSAVSWAVLGESMKDHSKKFPIEVFGCINTVFREAAMATETNIAAGRSIYFRDPNYTFGLGWGRETWPGIYSSARPCQWGITLNLDVANTAFYKKMNVVEFLREFIGGKLPFARPGEQPPPYRPAPTQLNDFQRKSFDSEMRTLKVEMRHGPTGVRRQRVTGVANATAASHKFENKGKMVTVADYFKNEYKIVLKYPNLPLLQIGSGKTMMPMEVCELMSQKVPRKLNEDQTAIMVRKCAQPAPDREVRINKLRKDSSRVNYDKNVFLDAFGIKVASEMVAFDGRILPAPTMSAGGPKGDLSVKRMDGTWEARNVPFKDPKLLKHWVFVNLCDPAMLNDDEPLDVFLSEFIGVGRQRGMDISKPSMAPRASNNPDFIKMFQQERAKNKDLQLIMVAIPRRGPQYADIKKAGDVEVGIVTQVVLGQKIEDHWNKRIMNQYVSNVMLKINAKLGGINTEVKEISPNNAILKRFVDKPTIIFGADVTHPSPGEKAKPSVAAVVASYNKSFTKYVARVRAQGARQEIMDTLKDMIRDLLIEFKNLCGNREPQRIIFYRDGVSEGQYFHVMVEELSAIQKACMELVPDGSYKPPITYIVVGKRHNTRLFAANPRTDAVGKAGNVPPGTTTDTAICHYLEFDWFTCSHFGIQGTSRPAHYNVLYDDSKYTADEIQLFSYYLTYVYARCNRSVSIPAPVYYAHHVAFRARAHLEEPFGNDTATVTSGSSGPALDVQALNRRIKVHENVKGMYFA